MMPVDEMSLGKLPVVKMPADKCRWQAVKDILVDKMLLDIMTDDKMPTDKE